MAGGVMSAVAGIASSVLFTIIVMESAHGGNVILNIFVFFGSVSTAITVCVAARKLRIQSRPAHVRPSPSLAGHMSLALRKSE
jgi:hypothetical protein